MITIPDTLSYVLYFASLWPLPQIVHRERSCPCRLPLEMTSAGEPYSPHLSSPNPPPPRLFTEVVPGLAVHRWWCHRWASLLLSPPLTWPRLASPLLTSPSPADSSPSYRSCSAPVSVCLYTLKLINTWCPCPCDWSVTGLFFSQIG